jgi:hypothetical protein
VEEVLESVTARELDPLFLPGPPPPPYPVYLQGVSKALEQTLHTRYPLTLEQWTVFDPPVPGTALRPA